MIPDAALNIFGLGEAEKQVLQTSLHTRLLEKNDTLQQVGEVCSAGYYLHRGALYMYRPTEEGEEQIIDLYMEGEWLLDHGSFISRTPSSFGIRAYEACEIYSISITDIHALIRQSPAFFTMGRILDQAKDRTLFFDTALTPAQKYDHLMQHRKSLFQKFPLRMIASYLKVTPETLSRVRSNQRFIS